MAANKPTDLPSGLARPAQRALTGATGKARNAGSAKRHATPPSAASGAAAVDAYLATLPTDQRAALQRLREIVRAVAPVATEVISYGIPMFKLGRGLVGFNAAGAHCTFQLMSTAVLEAHAGELTNFRTGKGSIRFTPDKSLPDALVRKLVKARVAENERLSLKPNKGAYPLDVGNSSC